MYFLFYAWAFDDAMKFEYLKFQNWFSREQRGLLEWNKKKFFKFQKSSLLELKNKLAKMQQKQPVRIVHRALDEDSVEISKIFKWIIFQVIVFSLFLSY